MRHRRRGRGESGATAAAPTGPTTVLHVIATDQRRGAETVASLVADHLRGPRQVHRLLALRGSGEASGVLSVDEVLGRGAPRIVTAWRLRRTLRDLRPDLVVAHGGEAAAVVAMSRLGGVPAPMVWHRILELPESMGCLRRLWWRWVAAAAGGVIALSTKTADEMRELGYFGPVWHIPNHRPVAIFHRRPSERRTGGITVGFVGRFVDQKDPHAFLDLVALVERPGVRFVMAGDGPLKASIEERLASEGSLDRVSLLGHVDDVPRLLSGLDCLVLTSTTESMTGTVVEAQLSGVPVIGYACDGISDVVVSGSTGQLVPQGDLRALAQALADHLDRGAEEIERMRTAAAAHATRFATETVAARYGHVFSWVMRSPSRRVLLVMPDVGVGGLERANQHIAARAATRGWSAALVTLRGDRRPRDETILPDLDENGVPRIDLAVPRPPTRSPGALAIAVRRLRRVARHSRARIVDAALLDATLPARIARAGASWRLVEHLVNTSWEPSVRRGAEAGRLRFHLLRSIDALTIRGSDLLVPISHAVRDSYVRRVRAPRRSMRVIERGVDPSAVPTGPTTDAARGPIRVLSVGRLVPQKGHATAIRAVARAHDEGLDVRLKIVGEGPLAHDLGGLVDDLGAGAFVEIIEPAVSTARHIEWADVYVQASSWEGQSNALLEAMAAALPAIVTDLPVFREVLGEAGSYFAAGDERCLSRRLHEMRAPARRMALGGLARDRAVQRFDLTDRLDDLYGQYERLASGTERP